MPITLVKKRLASGDPCPKCVQAEELLQRRGLSARIDRVVWAVEGEPDSEGWALARRHGVDVAPFFVVEDARGTRVYTSVLAFIKAELDAPAAAEIVLPDAAELAELAARFEQAEPREIVRWALQRFGAGCAIAFSGAEDVALIDLAVRSELPFSVFCLDTGRLHPETLRYVDRVRRHYGVAIHVASPEPGPVEELVRAKGLYSFYEDGHEECCAVRKVSTLRRVLAGYHAWMSGQRRDQSPTRTDVATIEIDRARAGKGGPLLKLNPLARWTLAQTWDHLRNEEAPTNELHERGYISIGCEPCTRAARPGEHERAGRWWWEEATHRECGLHLPLAPG